MKAPRYSTRALLVFATATAALCVLIAFVLKIGVFEFSPPRMLLETYLKRHPKAEVLEIKELDHGIEYELAGVFVATLMVEDDEAVVSYRVGDVRRDIRISPSSKYSAVWSAEFVNPTDGKHGYMVLGVPRQEGSSQQED